MSIFEQPLYNQEIFLNYGWNLISSYVIPYNTNLTSIFWFLIETNHLEMVKDGEGRSYNLNNGFNNISEWNPYEAYLVKVNRISNIIISGNKRINTQINLNREWNYISYPLNTTHSMDEIIREVFNPLGDNLIMIKDGFGRFYNREYNYNNIPSFVPGKGYQIKVNEKTVLDFSSLN